MGVGGVDTGEERLANQPEVNSIGSSDTGAADAQAMDASGAGGHNSTSSMMQALGPQSQGPAFMDPVKRVEQEHKAKLSAILNGSHTQATAMEQSSGYKSVMDPTPKKAEPWIGPDGGMIGRGIKAAGDWYMDYINGKRDTIMNTMKYELERTFNDQFVEV